MFRTAARMVELHDDLAGRVQVFKDRLVIPGRGASFQCLPAEPKRLEGLDYTLAILDESGVIGRDTYEVVDAGAGKRETSTLIGIGTPGPDPHNKVLADLRDLRVRAIPTTRRWCGGSSPRPGSRTTPSTAALLGAGEPGARMTSCTAMRMHALLPPKTREATFRRARLCQFVRDTDGKFLPPGVWEACRPGADPGRRRGRRRARRQFSRGHHGAAGRDRVGDTALRHRRGVGAARRVTTPTGCRSPRSSRRSGRLPPVAGRRDHRRPVPLDPHPASPGGRAAAGRRVPAQPVAAHRGDHRPLLAAVNGRMSHSGNAYSPPTSPLP